MAVATADSAPTGLLAARSRAAWAGRYRRRLALTDTTIVLLTMFGAQGLRDAVVGGAWWNSPVHTVLTLVISLGWLITIHVYGTRDARVVGVGGGEYRRIVGATTRVFGVFAIWCLLVGNDLGRGYLLIALPVGTALLVASRFLWRLWLHRERRADRCCNSVVLLGSRETALPVAADLRRNRAAGYRVLGLVGCGSPPAPGGRTGIPVLGDVDDLVPILERVGADTVVVTGSPDLSPDRLRALGWQLEDERFNLVLTPSLISVGGPRVHMSLVTGLSLLHVDTPRYEGVQRLTKRAFDLVGALLILAVFALPMLVVAAAVRITSPGPAMFRQSRIGREGRPFSMLKMRSMHEGSDAKLSNLLEAQSEQDNITPLFKVVDDPRITRVGAVIRKYSIDELPQLFNVIRGEMSLVGPRPQVAGEVELYDDAAHRRHLVQPGMTGLWQVSGRSALDWDDAIALDLHYVANWSVATDIGILLRTLRAVIAPGATAH